MTDPFGGQSAQPQGAQRPDDYDPLMAGEKVPSISWAITNEVGQKVDPQVGSYVSIEITEITTKEVQRRDYNDPNKLLTWPDGNPKVQIPFTGILVADTTGCQTVAIGEKVTLWAHKPSNLLEALVTAQVNAGSRIGSGNGGVLSVRFDGRTAHRSANATGELPKAFFAAYAPKAPADPLGAAQPPAQPQQQAAPPQPPAPPVQPQQPVQQQAPAQPAAPAAGDPWAAAPAAPAAGDPWAVAPSQPQQGQPAPGQPPF